MSLFRFLRENARWVGGGFLLTFFSAYGQTFFISLSAGHIRTEYALTNGQFGTLYMIATLASALTMPRFGQIVDRYSAKTVTIIIVPTLALACVLMAFSRSVLLLAATIYLLRLFGQGMMTQNAYTAMGRWFTAQRGRAVSLVALGHNSGEAVFPVLFVTIAGAVGWRYGWLVAAAALVLVALPAIASLIAVERAPRSSDPVARAATAPDWTRGEVLRDPLFYLLILGILAPGFISTTIFFHQVYLVELRGWSLGLFASSFTFMASMTVLAALTAGYLVDRFSAVSVLPVFLFPLAAACLTLAYFDAQWSAFVFMGLMGLSYGLTQTLFGAIWPEIYGARHLGAVRALAVALMVFATAIGPGLTGYLIDVGVDYPLQIGAMGLYCLAAAGLMFFVSLRFRRRSLQSERASVTPAS